MGLCVVSIITTLAFACDVTWDFVFATRTVSLASFCAVTSRKLCLFANHNLLGSIALAIAGVPFCQQVLHMQLVLYALCMYLMLGPTFIISIVFNVRKR